MQVGRFWIITKEILEGPWHVGSYGANWYIVNIENGKSKRIGPFRMKGTNYHDKAIAEAKARNSKLVYPSILKGTL